MRGPGVLPRSPGGPARAGPRQRFDDLVVAVVADVEERWTDRLGLVEYGVEDIPQVPDDWSGDVPLAALVRRGRGDGTRIVLFRRPIEHRAGNRAELEGLVFTVVVEQVAELLGLPPEEVDERYRSGPEG